MLYENDAAMNAIVAAIKPFLGPGEMVIRRGAFRWRGDDGKWLNNHYECQSLQCLCEDHGYELVHDLVHVGVIKIKSNNA